MSILSLSNLRYNLLSIFPKKPNYNSGNASIYKLGRNNSKKKVHTQIEA